MTAGLIFHQLKVKGLTLQLAIQPIFEYMHESAVHVATISYATEQQGDFLPASFGKRAVVKRLR